MEKYYVELTVSATVEAKTQDDALDIGEAFFVAGIENEPESQRWSMSIQAKEFTK